MGVRWKNVAIDELRNFESVQTSIEVLPELIERQETAIKRIRTSDPGKVSRSGGANNDALISAIVYRDELKFRLEEAQKTVKAINKALTALSKEECMILDILFIHPRKNGIDMVCEALCIERTAAYEKRNMALERFIIAFYGCL